MIFQHKSIQVDTIDAIRVEMTVEFVRWLDALDDAVKFRVVARLRQATAGHLGDCKHISTDLSEMRLHFGAGYRLYFTRRGRVMIVMLAGGDKGSQSRDIQRAKRILKGLGS